MTGAGGDERPGAEAAEAAPAARAAGARPVLVCASANPHKVEEIAAVLGDAVTLLPRPAAVPDVVEDADTFEGNARLKAVALCEATGRAAVADDTGLEVDALGSAPGVRSARFAGEPADDAANVAKLLADLAALPDGTPRTARFRTVALVRRPDGTEVVAEGTVEGHIASSARGTRGFGYDPVFVPDDGDGRTFAEMSSEEKNAISHRGRAFRALAARLAAGHR
jgi:XTP/dITP diphosphohydrolase